MVSWFAARIWDYQRLPTLGFRLLFVMETWPNAWRIVLQSGYIHTYRLGYKDKCLVWYIHTYRVCQVFCIWEVLSDSSPFRLCQDIGCWVFVPISSYSYYTTFSNCNEWNQEIGPSTLFLLSQVPCIRQYNFEDCRMAIRTNDWCVQGGWGQQSFLALFGFVVFGSCSTPPHYLSFSWKQMEVSIEEVGSFH